MEAEFSTQIPQIPSLVQPYISTGALQQLASFVSNIPEAARWSELQLYNRLLTCPHSGLYNATPESFHISKGRPI
jgi:hypothetical protein